MHQRERGARNRSMVHGVVGPAPQVVVLLKTAPALTPVPSALRYCRWVGVLLAVGVGKRRLVSLGLKGFDLDAD